MKQLFTKIILSAAGSFLAVAALAQTAGTLTFSYTPTSHSGYDGSKNVLAVWIQDGSGNFVKTRLRYAGGGDTKDHLPIWAVNSGGSSWNCMSSACNIVDATTGATLTGYSTKSISWDGTDVNGNIVADGTYQVTIESTWDHGISGNDDRSFSFTKGTSIDSQTPADDNNFTSISLTWTPDIAASVENTNSTEATLSVYPNPSNGIFNVNHSNVNTIKVFDISGNLVQANRLSTQNGISEINLTDKANGVYFVHVIGDHNTAVERIILNK